MKDRLQKDQNKPILQNLQYKLKCKTTKMNPFAKYATQTQLQTNRNNSICKTSNTISIAKQQKQTQLQN
jgi:hypothetical protein